VFNFALVANEKALAIFLNYSYFNRAQSVFSIMLLRSIFVLQVAEVER
jgi:hypothetical protein